MRWMVVVVGLSLSLAGAAVAGGGPENVLVVVNDESPDSLEVAHYYVHRRGIPRHHVVHLRLPSRYWNAVDDYTAYTALVEMPIRRWRAANPTSPITSIALCRHVPVRAPLAFPAGTPAPGDLHKSIAHLLATMDVTRPVARDAATLSVAGMPSRKGLNPYYRAVRSIDPRDPVAPDYPIVCVGTLNAFDTAEVRGMIDRSIASDRLASRGTVYLGRSRDGDPRGCYNPHFEKIQKILVDNHQPCEIVPWADGGELLTEKRDVIFYMFGQDVWSKEFPKKNTYLPGAIVDNLTSVALTPESFDRAAGGQTTMCFFLEAGASAVHGCVNEPYTAAFDANHTQLFRYLTGYNLYESFYMAHPLLPWMNLVAGDPIMQPFAVRPRLAEESFAATPTGVRWVVQAQATRPNSTILSVALYVNGALREQQEGGRGTFEIAELDPTRDHVVVVATDSSDARTQARMERGPRPAAGDSGAVRLAGVADGAVRIDLGGERTVAYYAPAARVPHGVFRGSVLALPLGKCDLRNTVEIWLDVDRSAPPQVVYLDLDAALPGVAIAAAEEAARGRDPAAMLSALAVLDSLALAPADRDRANQWRRDVEARAAAEWAVLDKARLAKPQPADLDALRAFAVRYRGSESARQAEARLAELGAAPGVGPADLEAQETEAARLYQLAQNLRRNRQELRARQMLTEIVTKYPDTASGKQARLDLQR